MNVRVFGIDEYVCAENMLQNGPHSIQIQNQIYKSKQNKNPNWKELNGENTNWWADEKDERKSQDDWMTQKNQLLNCLN